MLAILQRLTRAGRQLSARPLGALLPLLVLPDGENVAVIELVVAAGARSDHRGACHRRRLGCSCRSGWYLWCACRRCEACATCRTRSCRGGCRRRSVRGACSCARKVAGTCRVATPPAAGAPEVHATAGVSVRHAVSIGRAPNTALQLTALRRINAGDFTTSLPAPGGS
jgi:hypothetical protein